MSHFWKEEATAEIKRRDDLGRIRTKRISFRCRTVDDGLYSPDDTTQSSVRQQTFFVRRGDWDSRFAPRVGDVFTDIFDVNWAVKSVSEIPVLGWNCGCREVK